MPSPAEKFQSSKEVVTEVPVVTEVEAGEAPGRILRPDFGTAIEDGKAAAVVDRIAAQHDTEKSGELKKVRSTIDRIKETAHAHVEEEKADTEAIESLTPPNRIERLAATAERQQKVAAKAQRKGAIRSFLDSFRANRPQ
jgi:hypothetical protein